MRKHQACDIFLLPLFLLAGVLLVAGCKEATLGPERLGRVEGQVLISETNAALAGASVTTSPPTGALVTDADGRFVLEDIEAGNYTVTATRQGYETGTATVAVRGNRATQATLFLQATDDSAAATSMDVSISNWTTRVTQGSAVDSAFARVEYQARNTSETRIAGYEVYFRIETSTDTLFHEAVGDSLKPGQSDVSQFERYTLQNEAERVKVSDLYVETAE